MQGCIIWIISKYCIWEKFSIIQSLGKSFPIFELESCVCSNLLVLFIGEIAKLSPSQTANLQLSGAEIALLSELWGKLRYTAYTQAQLDFT